MRDRKVLSDRKGFREMMVSLVCKAFRATKATTVS